ncbi:MAG: DNA polymerase III subunit gamma/tau [Burkholderiaceae bacterium]|jgi:DNA polymerase-3 subunit gamma/tau
MSYQVLARKYRPKNFDSLVGQEHVVRALTHALEQKRLHHAYLFTGTRGVGKTTLSRILAKALNCQGTDGSGDITAHPCGVCDACVAIDAGRFVDYIEMDAASNRGVDEMAQLLEQAVYAPSNARFKVYMIDEVHMLSNHAFNAMLKTLEEPPPHIKFILATTDPQKIPVTVLSRCMQFNLKQMPPGQIVGHLENILGQEGISFDAPALRLLAQGAQGSMRDALSLTDQAIAYAAGKVSLDAVQGMLGALDHAYLVRMLDALAVRDAKALLDIADEMAARSLSWSSALQDLGTLLNRIAIAQTVPSAVPDDLPERDDIVRLAPMFSPEDVQLYYQIVVHGRHELGLAPDEYSGFTMTLLRMLAFAPIDASSNTLTAPASSRATTAASGSAAASAAAAARPISVPAAPRTSTTSAATTPTPEKPASRAMAALAAARASKTLAPAPSAQAVSATGSMASAPVVAANPTSTLASSPTTTVNENRKATQSLIANANANANANATVIADTNSTTTAIATATVGGLGWPVLVKQLALRGVARQLAMQSELLACEDDGQSMAMRIRVPVDTLLSAGSKEKLMTALSEHLGKSVQLDTEIGATKITAHAAEVAEEAERQRHAEQTLQEDPFVQTLMREFGATIVPGSVRPL